jgi:hypothetical protein
MCPPDTTVQQRHTQNNNSIDLTQLTFISRLVYKIAPQILKFVLGAAMQINDRFLEVFASTMEMQILAKKKPKTADFYLKGLNLFV